MKARLKIRAFIIGTLLAFCAAPSFAAETTIPRAALEYRAQLIREARAVWANKFDLSSLVPPVVSLVTAQCMRRGRET